MQPNAKAAGFTGRRSFLRSLAIAGAAGITGVGPALAAAEPPPETKRIRLMQIGGVCVAPQYVAEDILPGEGFSDIQYVKAAGPGQIYPKLATGEADISMAFIAPFVVQVEAGTTTRCRR